MPEVFRPPALPIAGLLGYYWRYSHLAPGRAPGVRLGTEHDDGSEDERTHLVVEPALDDDPQTEQRRCRAATC